MRKLLLLMIIPSFIFATIIKSPNTCENETIINELKNIINKENGIDIKDINISKTKTVSTESEFNLCQCKIKITKKTYKDYSYIVVPIKKGYGGLPPKIVKKYKDMKEEQNKYVRVEFYKELKIKDNNQS
jgi:hypothetical protein